MQIPLTLPEQTTPLPTRRDIQALSPVSPVPGVEGLAETLDPRLAVQWTQPVLGDQSSDATRSALASAIGTPSGSLGQPAPGPSTPPSVSWSSLAQVLGPWLQRLSESGSRVDVQWPTSAGQPLASDNLSTSAQGLLQALNTLHRQLTQSDLFAPQHLIRHWFKPPDIPESSVGANDTPDTPTLSRWVSALSTDSPTAEQITRLLLTGKMQWQGELLPGIAVQLDREDAWREDPQRPGQIQKGAALRAQIDLPRSGRLSVVAYQWGAHVDVRVHMPSGTQNPLVTAWPLLQERLAQLNVPSLHLQRTEAP